MERGFTMKHKKLTILCLSFLLLCSSLFAASSIPIYIEGKVINSSSTPAYISSTQRTMIPVRAVGEVLGLQVDWKSPEVILTGKHQSTQKMLTVRINSKTQSLWVNDKLLTQCIEIKDGRSYITLRVLAEAFGYSVDWKNKSVYITKPLTPPVTNKPEVNEPTTNTQTSFEDQVLALVNKERIAVGLTSLTMDESLRNVARIKSTDMRTNGYFSHTSPTYGSPFDMMKQFSISYTKAGENIAQGYTTPETVVKGWMNSSGHRKNILDSDFTHIGIGYDSNGHYWTQMFIKK